MHRFFCHYKLWECFQNGMYEKSCFMDERQMIKDCKATLTCQNLLWEAMTFVSHNWLHSAKQHLSNVHRNRQAYLGQAACCWLDGSPEYITKRAWNELDSSTQKLANATADEVIKDWEDKYRSGCFGYEN